MPKIDHDRRKAEIVAESIKLFARFGYSAVNFGMIARNIGIARTLLYTYFKNKREIFNEAIDGVTRRVEAKYAEVVHSRQSADAKLRQICMTVFAMLFDNRDFVCVIADVLASYRRKDGIPLDRVDAHTKGVKRVIRSLIGEAIRRGEYKKDVNALKVMRLIYSQFEALALRITITGRAELSECIDQMDSILFALKI
ncbi:MAG: TetR/AcrR family transcriptional regulator [Kiritimatiellae bacterium]|nr:TetR/AcrR family transcriptional regulator [Kiritimatiellia bacterium]